MKLIVGLGNPGPEYAKTRHNVGFMLVDRLATRHQLTDARHKFHAGILEGELHVGNPMRGEKCMLMQPTTYMNRSGLAVAEAMNFYKLDPQNDLMVIVDDLALDCGVIRLRAEGSPGGHNGLIDIERALGTRKYPRLRIGIDPRGYAKQSDYVLGQFTGTQWEHVDHALDKAVKCVESWLVDGVEKTMSVFNTKAGT